MSTSKTLHKRPVYRKIFTPSEADATLPLVSAIVTDLVDLSCELTERRQRLSRSRGERPESLMTPIMRSLFRSKRRWKATRQGFASMSRN